MWVCDPCRTTGGWEANTARQFGPCEACGAEKLCYDIDNRVRMPQWNPAGWLLSGESIMGEPVYVSVGDVCGHCGAGDVGADLPGGFGSYGVVPLCHPDDADRLDCYKLVTIYRHGFNPCGKCEKEGQSK